MSGTEENKSVGQERIRVGLESPDKTKMKERDLK